MSRVLLILSICFVLGCSTKPKQSADSIVDTIFFHVDLNAPFEKVYVDYCTKTFLTASEPKNGFTLYPPLSALIDTSKQYLFDFYNHPYYSLLDKRGTLKLHHRKDNLVDTELIYLFKASQNAKEFYYSVGAAFQEHFELHKRIDSSDYNSESYYREKDSPYGILVAIKKQLNQEGCPVSIKLVRE